jgi:hypothetical protein
MYATERSWLWHQHIFAATALFLALTASLLICCSLACTPDRATVEPSQKPAATLADERPRQCWWFPSDIPAQTAYRYHMTLDAVITDRRGTTKVAEQTDFAVAVLPAEPGEPGCIVRMLPPDPSSEAATGVTPLFVRWIAAANPDGVLVTRSEVLAHDVPLFRGPWRAGDRFSVFGLGAWTLLLFSDYIVGTVHFDVVAVTPTSAKLTFGFWAGRTGPALRGNGELTFESDEKGVTAIRAVWNRTFGAEKREARLTITRTGIGKLQEEAAAMPVP